MSVEKRIISKAIHTTIRSSELEQIENWRRVQSSVPALATAVRTFVIRGLKASTDIPATRRTAAKDSAA